MIKWIKNLFVSQRLRAANSRILELETEVESLKKQIAKLEDTFVPNIPDEVHYAVDEA